MSSRRTVPFKFQVAIVMAAFPHPMAMRAVPTRAAQAIAGTKK